ncbi:MAG: hypothetical protein FWE37_05035 [Spirochaetaceae bacterium]|nr:hypothetical protein [Spirochaetaceae bacterium]
MKQLGLTLLFLLFLVPQTGEARLIVTAEQWYRLYHQHLHRIPENEWENLVYLENALNAPFANPLNALTRITSETEWQRYQYLFRMHVNLQIVRTYIAIATKYDRQRVYFFNAPWRRQNLESLEMAEAFYGRALFFWQQALPYIELLNRPEFRWIEQPEIRFWQDELSQIRRGALNFELIINNHLERVALHRDFFENLPDTIPNDWHYGVWE